MLEEKRKLVGGVGATAPRRLFVHGGVYAVGGVVVAGELAPPSTFYHNLQQTDINFRQNDKINIM